MFCGGDGGFVFSCGERDIRNSCKTFWKHLCAKLHYTQHLDLEKKKYQNEHHTINAVLLL